MARKQIRPAAKSTRPQKRPKGPWKHGPVPVLGLIGGIGAGKSLVGRIFADRGAVVLDADAIGHALLDQKPAREEVVKRFGTRVLENATGAPGESPRINRLVLGALVFGQPQALRDLESILHPRMRRTFERVISRAVRGGSNPAVVLDAAVLLEAGWNDLCDAVVFVDAPREMRLERLRVQRGWSAEKLDSRERAQLPLDEKRRRAHHVINNDSDAEALRAAAEKVWHSFVKADVSALNSRSAKPPNRAASSRGSSP
jgi:dephospho-CoA kinase